ncbi:hypothetical protein C8E87_2619 [Paractinoplanes brasiliensis]|uniref:Uncharacterized protein n=1 Tax=Paractinoplanes brasiliensis TaxID=52695 RepID=A0A4R6JRB2_9ACTN|nr:hypothetical protein C8E87_2619 [Actinoplanes brasiliensis]
MNRWPQLTLTDRETVREVGQLDVVTTGGGAASSEPDGAADVEGYLAEPKQSRMVIGWLR